MIGNGPRITVAVIEDQKENTMIFNRALTMYRMGSLCGGRKNHIPCCILTRWSGGDKADIHSRPSLAGQGKFVEASWGTSKAH